MCWNRLAGQESRPLTKETVAPKHISFLHPTDHLHPSGHLPVPYITHQPTDYLPPK